MININIMFRSEGGREGRREGGGGWEGTTPRKCVVIGVSNAAQV